VPVAALLAKCALTDEKNTAMVRAKVFFSPVTLGSVDDPKW